MGWTVKQSNVKQEQESNYSCDEDDWSQYRCVEMGWTVKHSNVKQEQESSSHVMKTIGDNVDVEMGCGW